MKKTKSLLTLLLAMVLTLSLFPVSGAAAHTKTVYLKTKQSEYANDRLERYTLYTYDMNGVLAQEDIWARDSEAGEFDWHAQYLYVCNPQGDITRSTYLRNDKLIEIYDYEYTYGAQYTKRTAYETYVYIAQDVKGYNGCLETYYDASGNVRKVLHYDAQDQLKSGLEYAYDAQGKQICEIRYAYNSSGEVTGTSQTLYEYDADNRLTREYDPDHPYTVWKTYTYNESNQLIRMQYSREIGPDDGSVYPFTTEYTYDEHGNLVSETTTIRSRSRINPFVIHTSVRRVDYEYQAFEIPVPPPFEDIEPDGYYRYAVEWAVESGVTKGTSKTTFSPDKTCTRAEAVAFLWRVKGEPEPKTTATRFSDVPADTWYSKAVAWAVETGVTNGFPDGSFRPTDTCTRAQIVTFLWRANSSPAPKDGGTRFPDVPADEWYSSAVAWADEAEVTNGFPDGTFCPDEDCTRSQIVTFLYRAEKK